MSEVLTAAIDLDSLPDVEYVGQLTHDEITEQSLQWINDQYGIEITGAESPDYRIVRAGAYREMLLRKENNQACLNLTLKHAKDAYLDHIGTTYHRTPRLDGELDDAYRRRIALSPEARSVAGPDGAYRWHVLNADPSVRDAKTHELAEGAVGIYVLTNTGDLSDELKTKIENVVHDQTDALPQEVRPMSIEVSVLPCVMLDYEINATLTIANGVDAALASEAALFAAQSYTDQNMQIGGRVVESFIDHYMHVPGVTKVDLDNWNDVEATLTQAPRATAINITTELES